jgi:hypothetical protein
MNDEFWQSAQDFWHSGQEAWEALTPEAQSLLRAAGVVVATLVAAWALGWQVGRKLRAGHFDAAFRRPWFPAPAAGRPDAHMLTPARLVTGLVRLTVWGGGLWCLARLYGWTDLARGLEWVAVRAWLFAGITVAALYLSRLFSEKLVEIVQVSPLRQKLDAWLPAAGVREPRVSGAAMVAGLLVDAVLILLVSLVAADLMGWALTGSALATAWQLVLHVATAGVALLIGWLGARWVRAQVVAEAGPASSPARVGYYVGTGVMGGATLLAILLLAGNSPTYLGLALLVLFVLLLWPAQAWLPDIYAGAVLRAQGVKEVQIDGSAYRLGAVGLVQTELLHAEETRVRRNRVVLEAHLGSPSEGDGPRSEAGSEAGSPNGKPQEAGKAKE